jgi:hypothetical protein
MCASARLTQRYINWSLHHLLANDRTRLGHATTSSAHVLCNSNEPYHFMLWHALLNACLWKASFEKRRFIVLGACLAHPFTVKLEAVHPFKMLVNFYQTIRAYTPEYSCFKPNNGSRAVPWRDWEKPRWTKSGPTTGYVLPVVISTWPAVPVFPTRCGSFYHSFESTVFWDVTPCSLVGVNPPPPKQFLSDQRLFPLWHFSPPLCPLGPGSPPPPHYPYRRLTLLLWRRKQQVPPIQRHIPADSNLHRRENLRPQTSDLRPQTSGRYAFFALKKHTAAGHRHDSVSPSFCYEHMQWRDDTASTTFPFKYVSATANMLRKSCRRR